MIEVATGVAFLMSSLYGVGQANAATTANMPSTVIQAASQAQNSVATTSPANNKGIEAYVKESYADEPILVDIARCESTFRQFGQDGKVIRGLVNNQDVGVMQINERYHAAEAAKMGIDIYTVEGNVAFARHLYEKYGTDPWSSSEKCWGQDLAGR